MAPKIQVLASRPDPNSGRKRPISRFEQMAGDSSRLVGARSAVLATLLDATLPALPRPTTVLAPLWADEAMHRAFSLVRLVSALDRRVPLRRNDTATARVELNVARDLAGCFRSLTISDGEQLLRCTDALRSTVRDLVELFGLAVGHLELDVSIDPLWLPACKRRALVLAASELVMDALFAGFEQGRAGCLGVNLRRVAGSRAQLSICYDGAGTSDRRTKAAVSGLAELLESELVYSVLLGGGTRAEITFPVHRLTRDRTAEAIAP